MTEASTESLEKAMSHLCERGSPDEDQIKNFTRNMKWINDARSNRQFTKVTLHSRKKVHSILSDLYHGPGIVVFLLCTISMPPSVLNDMNSKAFAMRVRE